MTALTQQQVDRFNEQGYLVVEDVLDIEQDIQPVVAEYEALLDDLCRRWHAEGKLSSTFADLPFDRRLIHVFQETREYYEHFDISLSQSNLTADSPVHVGPAVFNLLTSPRLLDAVESIVGPEIYSNPIQHVRIKIPEKFVPAGNYNALVRTTAWHQDQGVTLPEADESSILTVWLPITEATIENGCLQLIPGSHQSELALHCPGSSAKTDLHIPDPLLRHDKITPVPVKRGGVLFMHQRTQHASLSNQSDSIRWSFDLRYNPAGQPTGRPMFPGFVARSRANPAGRPQW